jgi:hypothetical protein
MKSAGKLRGYDTWINEERRQAARLHFFAIGCWVSSWPRSLPAPHLLLPINNAIFRKVR